MLLPKPFELNRFVTIILLLSIQHLLFVSLILTKRDPLWYAALMALILAVISFSPFHTTGSQSSYCYLQSMFYSPFFTLGRICIPLRCSWGHHWWPNILLHIAVWFLIEIMMFWCGQRQLSQLHKEFWNMIVMLSCCLCSFSLIVAFCKFPRCLWHTVHAASFCYVYSPLSVFAKKCTSYYRFTKKDHLKYTISFAKEIDCVFSLIS